MKASPERVAEALRASLKETERLRLQNRRLLDAASEPIAIVGMACRYPGGADSPDALWQLLAAGGDAISGFPGDRGWELEDILDRQLEGLEGPRVCGGGFLDDAADFDAEFFGISPREALGMDPQQRLLLEASWQALEDAGIDPGTLRGTRSGVFAGAMYHDYGWGLSPGQDSAAYLSTGGSSSLVSGRVAYMLGLEGPALSVDTACSSSLVALHLATRALRDGECSLALAGGVAVYATPGVFVQFSRQRALSPSGRCRSYAESADGAGFSEGVGMLVLERLGDAQRNGHAVLATIRGSAVNQDGASNGITAPNGPAQEMVIRQALESARLGAEEIDAIEGHGTGTTLGDPIEANALLATYGAERPRERPLRLGSIKSNIGHSQAAAGVAGVIKMVLALREGVLPRTLHVDAPSSKVDWSSGAIELLTEPAAWKPGEQPRRAGISSFGASGTNAHLILEEAPAAAPPGSAADDGAEPPPPGPVPLLLSAKNADALREAARRLDSHLRARPELDLTDVAYSLATARSSFDERAAVVGSDREELIAGLTALGRGAAATNATEGRARRGAKIAFLFSGHGSQWEGMARGLLDHSPVFSAKLRECGEALAPYTGWSVEDVLRGAPGGPSIEAIDVVQPLIFSVMTSLAALWRSQGVEPAVVLGHSQGEVAAAHVAGGLSLEDAARVVAVRSKMIEGLTGKGGGMVTIELPGERLAAFIEPWEGRIEVAAVNGPAAAVLAGERASLDELLERCAADGVRARDIPGAVAASHSAQMEILREDLLEALAPISPRSGEIPFHSTVTGELLDTSQLDAEYWFRNARRPVLLEPVTRALLEQGHDVLIEVTSHPVLLPSVQATVEASAEDPSRIALLGTLRRNDGGPERFALSLAEAHVAGAAVDWEAYFAGRAAKAVRLPTYPFQRQRYWLSAALGGGDPAAIGQAAAGHPLLGAVVEAPSGEGLALTGRISLQSHPWLADHAAFGTVLLPGTAFVELALRAGAECGAEGLEELIVEAPLILPDRGAVQLRVSLAEPDEEGRRAIAIHSRPEGDGDAGEAGEWTQHASGVLMPVASEASAELRELAAAPWPPPGAEPIGVDALYDRLAARGVEYGASFQGLTAAWREGEELYAEVSLPGEQAEQAQRFTVHPALLDAVGHAGIDLALDEVSATGSDSLLLPFAWRGARVVSGGSSSLRVRISADGADGSSALWAVDENGQPAIEIDSLVLRPIEKGRLQAGLSARRSLHRLEWREIPAAAGEAAQPDVADFRAPTEQGSSPAAAARSVTARALELLQERQRAEGFEDSLLVVLTQGAVAVEEGEEPDLGAAALVGLLRSARSEHPGRFALVDTDGSEPSQAALDAALAAASEQPEIALREGRLLVPRLARVDAAGEVSDDPIDPERTVLITGGSGAIGGLVARHLVTEHGARRLLLASRRGREAEGVEELEAELVGLGAEVTVAACDVAERDHVEELLGSIPAEHPLGAVFHAAAVLDDGVLESLDAERLARVMGPKADAAWHLHELTAGADLSAFVLFSSVMGILGGAAQANYAAANAFLDALAAHRRANGLPGTSLAWGGWARDGAATGPSEAAELERVARQVRERLGLAPMPASQGLALLDAALVSPDSLLAPVVFDSAVLRSQAAAGTLPGVLAGLVRVPVRRGGGSLAGRLAGLSADDREREVLAIVRSHVAAVLGLPSPAEVEPKLAFRELGFDSLGAVELRNRLVAATGLQLAATAVFDYPSAAALSKHIESVLGGGERLTALAPATVASDEPIAIVGMACRYPGGADSPDALWQLLAAGRDAISGFPEDRGWDLERLFDPDPDHRGTSYVREAGFVFDVADFDAGFFGISPREALATDAQQRLLLEASWEALESAGIDPGSLGESQTGVFAGSMYNDYGNAVEGVAPGMSSSAITGRIAYTLGLQGPAITVDTACSSSLVAIHLAAQALHGGECSLALAGGVSVLATPNAFSFFSNQRALAPDGRSKAFAEAADGVAVSEGVGLLVLERLSDAERNGHPVLATIRGSAVNQDGASNGLTAPNGPSQERVIRQALANARLRPNEIDAVEAHGTGTTLGDPIEAGALLATYGQEREAPLKLGSIKSNLGHSQAAAGVAGVIKMVMAIREGLMPKTLHVDSPSSKVDWEAGQIELLTEAEAWQANGRPRRAGVSSFGISGTNAHLILEQGPAPSEVEGEDGAATPLPGQAPLVLSAKSEPALREAASRLAAHLRDDPELEPTDVAFSLTNGRAAFEHRAVAVGEGREALLGTLSSFALGEDAPGLAGGIARSEQRPVFLFPGQGSQWLGMGAELAAGSPVFSRSLEQCEEALAPYTDFSVRDVVLGAEDAASIERIEVVQPALFAVMVSLAALWRACGVHPAATVGHSQGEIAAAHVAGGLSLDDAARLAALRSQLISRLAGQGAMVSVALPAGGLDLSPWQGRVEVAAQNGPSSTILSADRESATEFLARCEREGVRAREIPATIPSHSARVEPLREELLAMLAGISPRSGEVPFHSTVSGGLLDTEELGPEYWYRNLRHPVLFEQVTRGLLEQGHGLFVEVSPHPVFALAVRETIEDAGAGQGAAAIGTLRREEGGPERFCLSLAEAYAAGVEVEWPAFFEGAGASAAPLPTYPFQRERYWLNASEGPADAGSIGQADPDHPLLGAVVEDPEGGGLTLTGRLSAQTHSWLKDHAVAGTVLLPGAAFLELALTAAERAGTPLVEELALEAPLALPERGATQIQVSLTGPGEKGRRRISIHSRIETGGEEAGEWTCHARGTLSPAPEEPEPLGPLGPWPPEAAQPLDLELVHERLAEAGFEYGPTFRGLTAAWQDGEELYAEVSLPEERAADAARLAVQPALLELAAQALQYGAPTAKAAPDTVTLPGLWRGVSLHPGGLASRVRVTSGGDHFGLVAFDGAGAAVISVDSVAAKEVDPGRSHPASRRFLHRVRWETPAEPASAASVPGVAILGEAALAGLEADCYPDLPALLEAVGDGDGPELVLADFRAAGQGDDLPAACHEIAQRALALAQAWIAADPRPARRLVFLTEGAMSVGEEDEPNLATAALAGLLRSAWSEHPGAFALLDTDSGEFSLPALASALMVSGEEPQLAMRKGKLLAPRLARVSDEDDDAPAAAPVDPDSTVLICGGCGGLGGLVARHLASEHGARRLLLADEDGEGAEGAAQLRAELEDLGASVRIEACDLGDRAELERLLGSIAPESPLGAVIHAAAVLDDGMLESLDPERLERTMRPKVDSAWHLHELTAELELSQFILFSSVSGLLGGAAQANYSAANAFLDALAAHRRRRNLPATSLAWGLSAEVAGPGKDGGPAAAARTAERVRARLGLAPMPGPQIAELFEMACALDESLLAPARLDPGVLRAQAKAGALPAILRGLVQVPARVQGGAGALAVAVAALPELERETMVLDAVRSHIATVLGHDSAADIESDRALRDLGFDSLGAVELRNRLAADTGLSLPAALAFDHPSAAALAEYLSAEMSGDSEDVAVAPLASVASEEPIAIVGIGCRYPGGADSPELLWQLVAEGRDAIAGLPGDRSWDLEHLDRRDTDEPGTSPVRSGGFLDGVADFDPGFFGIAPRDAAAIDPQQRLILEAAWEALEDAGIEPASLRGSDAGVFLGAASGDYAWLLGSQRNLGTSGSMLTGASSSVVPGRVSYTLGLEGPSVAVDTACSSSLVALHLASQALRAGECSAALAGGVLVMSTPAALADLNPQRGLAPDGRCKAFADSADGTGASEGVGVVLLERLSDAERLGHPVLATIRGSAINQDGASNGLTAPSGPSQQRVIRQALANARLQPNDVDAVEAHGTGTVLGDPIEAEAVLATYGQDRESPLWLGSIKSNLGHSGAAAGVAGVIKMVMAMRAGVLPKTLHVDRPSTKIDWSAGAVELLTENVAWEANGEPRRAGISSFGMSGTNAHVIIEEAPGARGQEAATAIDDGDAAGSGVALPGVLPLVISAKTESALRATAERLSSRLEQGGELDLTDVGYSLATTRATFSHRAVALGQNRDALQSSLEALARGSQDRGLIQGGAGASRKPAFLFPGFGSQWQDMAVELLDSAPAFANGVRECGEALDPYVEWSLEEVFRGAADAPGVEKSEVVPMALFAAMVSLARLWRASGVEPAVVAGHSLGELAAAHVAGGLTLDDAARVVVMRTRGMEKLFGKGAMASVALGADELESRLRPFGDAISLAVINGPTSAVVSGGLEPLDEFLEQCAADGVQAKKIPGAVVASHSAQVDALRDELLDGLAPISPRSGDIPFYSTVTGEAHDTALLDAEYWYRNFRRTVRLEPVVRRLVEAGCHQLIEVSPHPILEIGLRETVETLGDSSSVAVLGTLRRGEGGPQRFARSLAAAHVAGAEVNWERYFEGSGARRVKLPTYAFQRQRYWLDAATSIGDTAAAGMADAEHPLLAVITETPAGGWLFNGRVSLADQRWLAGATVFGATQLLPSVFAELAMSVARRIGAEQVRELTLQAPLSLPEQGAVQLQVAVEAPEEEGEWPLAIYSRPIASDDEETVEWLCHAAGALSARALEPDPPDVELSSGDWPPEGAQPVDVELLHDMLGDRGLNYAPASRSLRGAWRRDDELFAEVSLSEEQASGASRFEIDPALLDAAVHAGVDPSLGRLGAEDEDEVELLQPYCWRNVGLYGSGATALRLRVRLSGEGASLLAVDADGARALSVGEILCRPLEPSPERAAWHLKSIYQVDWPELDPRFGSEAIAGTAILGEDAIPGLDAERYDDIPSLLAATDGKVAPQVVVADLATAEDDSGPVLEAAHANSRRMLDLLQAWLASEPLQETRLTVLTRGAVAPGEGDPPDLATAPLWGMVRSAQAEHPGRFALLDLDASEASRRALPVALACGAQEPQLAVSEGRLLVPRLARAEIGEEASARPIDPNTTVLITGGLSGAGAAVARRLAGQHQIRHLLLVSRRGRQTEGAAELERELSELGAEVTIAACDVAEREQLEALLDSVPAEHPLGAVVHSAAVLDNGVLESLDAERLERVLRPKVDAAWRLHELTAELDLSQFVLFSSGAGILGTAAQVNYAAANVFLDSLAVHRQASGLPATSLAWGGWVQQSSLVAELSEADRARIGRLGIVPMLPDQALDLFDLARASGRALLAPVGLNRAGLRAQAKAGTLPAVLRSLIPASADRPGPNLRARLAAAPAPEREAIVLDFVREQAAAVLGYRSADEVEADRALQEMGFDSLGAVELRNQLAAATGLSVPMLALANHPTPRGVAGYLAAQLSVADAGELDGANSPSAESSTAFVTMLDKARQEQRLEEFMEVLATASSFRQTFDGPEALGALPEPVRLGAGEHPASLVLFSSIGPMSGPHEYVKFARAFDQDRDVFAFPLPGFIAGESLPTSIRALAEVYAEALSQLDLGADYLLAGHSSGGWIAHALASHLEGAGAPPSAVVLLDTYPPRSETLRRMLPRVLEGLGNDDGPGTDDVRLTALGAYGRLFSDWSPTELTTPTLMVRPALAVEGVTDEAASVWAASQSEIEVPGDHFSMIGEYAAASALAVQDAFNTSLKTANT